jgi:dTDP-4-dehydrorhamnose 3,5-epimerase
LGRFDFTSTPIQGLRLVQRKPIGDDRGFLARLYCSEEFGAVGALGRICQINHTTTRRRGTVRGMHFQLPPHSEQKLVTCVRGEIFDVAIDLRRDSPTFLTWHAEVLSAENLRAFLIPEGFAHGYQTLVEDCELIYLHSAAHQAASERALNALDPALSIRWPLRVEEMSDRDRSHPMLDRQFVGVPP